MHGVSTFIGSFEHNLDAKNRLFVPAKFRDALTSTFVIKLLPSQYPCIQCFSKDEYDAYAASVLAGLTDPVRQRKKQFELYAGATEVTVDAQGRIMIPTASTQRAKIEKAALVVGMGDHVEIWDPATFNAYYDAVSAESIAYEQASEAEESVSLERKANGDYLPG